MQGVAIAGRGIAAVHQRGSGDVDGVILDLAVRGDVGGAEARLTRPSEPREGLVEHRVAGHDDFELDDAVTCRLIRAGAVVLKVQRDFFGGAGGQHAVAVEIHPCGQIAAKALNLGFDGGEEALDQRRNGDAIVIVGTRVTSVAGSGVACECLAQEIGGYARQHVQCVAVSRGRIGEVCAGRDRGQLQRPGEIGVVVLAGGMGDDDPVHRRAETDLNGKIFGQCRGREGVVSLSQNGAIGVCFPQHRCGERPVGNRRLQRLTREIARDGDGFVEIKAGDVEGDPRHRRVKRDLDTGVLLGQHRRAAIVGRIKLVRRADRRRAQGNRLGLRRDRAGKTVTREGTAEARAGGGITGPIDGGETAAVADRQVRDRGGGHVHADAVGVAAPFAVRIRRCGGKAVTAG